MRVRALGFRLLRARLTVGYLMPVFTGSLHQITRLALEAL